LSCEFVRNKETHEEFFTGKSGISPLKYMCLSTDKSRLLNKYWRPREDAAKEIWVLSREMVGYRCKDNSVELLFGLHSFYMMSFYRMLVAVRKKCDGFREDCCGRRNKR
jgi:hypothetical protein